MERLPDLYAQLTPHAKRLAPTSTKYWLSGYPELVAEWHPTRNGELYPDLVRYGSERRVWWRCPRGPDHEWSTPAKFRVRGAGCPFCSRRYVSVTNSLATLRPDVAAQWHRTRNKPLQPKDVIVGSGRRVWWKCPKATDHEWEARVATRTSRGDAREGAGCPFCTGNRVARSNSLATVAPKLARQWHPTKNGTLTPLDVTRGSHTRVWWQCAKGHAWETTVMARGTEARGCPYCSGHRATPATSLARQFPVIARAWHPTKNGELTARDVTPFSHRPVWWRCARGHEWARDPARQMRHGTCPFCTGHRVDGANTLRALQPALAREWHPTRNGKLTPDDVTARSGVRVWWRCSVVPRHVWMVSVHSRTNWTPPSGCPKCRAGRRSS